MESDAFGPTLMGNSGADDWGLAVGIVGLVLTVVFGVAPSLFSAVRRRRPVKRSSQRGAWERVSRVRELAEHTSGNYLDHVVQGSLKAAVRADAQTELRVPVLVPFVSAVAMLLLTAVVTVDGDLLRDAPAPAFATLLNVVLTARNALLNESNRQSIDALIEREDPLLLTDPWTAVENFREESDPEESKDPWLLLATQNALRRRRRRLNRFQWKLTIRRLEVLRLAQRAWKLQAVNEELRKENERLKQRGIDDGSAGRSSASAAE